MPSVTRDVLRKYLDSPGHSDTQQKLAQLRLEYSSMATTANTFLAALQDQAVVRPTILPTQSSGRWSYLDPPISNFPKACINAGCPPYHHEWTDQCWSARDCFMPAPGTFWIEHDLDAVEHRIYCLILGWTERLAAMAEGLDIHTPTACDLFQLPYPSDLRNPHSSQADAAWRRAVQWQGKDDRRRTMGKNFTFGSQFSYVYTARPDYKPREPQRNYQGLVYNPGYVWQIPHIESYKVLDATGQAVTPDFEGLAIRYMESTVAIQKRKATWQARIKAARESRNLYGAPRKFWLSDQHTAKEGFNQVVQGTVASYINETAIMLQEAFPHSWLIHNQHDSLKWAFPYTIADHKAEEQATLAQCKEICQRTLSYQGRSIRLTATFRIKRGSNHATP